MTSLTTDDDDPGGKPGWDVGDRAFVDTFRNSLLGPLAIRVNGVVRDITAPTLVSASIADSGSAAIRASLTLQFNEAIADTDIGVEPFTVNVDGQQTPVLVAATPSEGVTDRLLSPSSWG